jgi:hypothetical protein
MTYSNILCQFSTRIDNVLTVMRIVTTECSGSRQSDFSSNMDSYFEAAFRFETTRMNFACGNTAPV